MRPFCFVFVFLFSFLSAQEVRQEHIIESLEFLPSWCDASLFFLEKKDLVGGGASEFDQNGRPTLFERSSGDRAELLWQEDLLKQVSLFSAEDGRFFSYFLSYDSAGRLSSFSLSGNLTGTGEGTYRTDLVYDEEGRLLERKEQSGRVFSFLFPGEGSDYFVARDSGLGLRKAFREHSGCGEEIEDDGESLDLYDLSGVSWRTWTHSTATSSGEKVSLLFGAYDFDLEKDRLLRRELFFSNKVNVFDNKKNLISTVLKTEEEPSPLFLSREDLSVWLDRYFRKQQHPLLRAPEKGPPRVLARTARGEPARLVGKGGQIEEREYSLDGFLIKQKKAGGSQVLFENDLGGRPTVSRYIRRDGSVEKEVFYSYRGSFLTGWKDSLGGSALFERDVFGRVIHAAIYQNKERETEIFVSYDVLSRPIQIEVLGKTENKKYRRSFSVDGMIVEYSVQDETGSQGLTVKETRRKNGTILKKEEVFSHQTVKTFFDEKQRVVRIDRLGEGGAQTVFLKEYDLTESGNCRERTTFNNKTRVEQIRSPCGELLYQAWRSAEEAPILEERVERVDENGSFCLRQEAGKHTRSVSHIFNSDGRLQEVVSADGSSLFFFYDEEGRLSGKRVGGGETVSYFYDERGNVERIVSEDESIDYRLFYDERGRVCRARDCKTDHEVVRAFDQFGRLVVDGETESRIRFSYRDRGEIEEIFLPDGSSVSYREGKGGPLCILRNGEKYISPSLPKQWPYSGSTASLRRNNKDAQGKWTQKLSFDALQQLCREEGEFNEVHRFSPLGSLEQIGLHKTVSDSALRVIQAGPLRAQYDVSGNMVQREGVFDACSYEYDALGRLCRVLSDQGKEERYRYDAFNRLQEIEKDVRGKKRRTRLFWFDEMDLGSLGAEGVTGVKIIHPKTRAMIGCEIGGEFYKVDCDDRGSVIALYGDKGQPVEIYRYSAFGQMHCYDETGKRVSRKARSPWLFCGKRKLFVGYDFGARRYDPVFMRWFERDPLGITDSVDDRMFVRNNPVDFVDPTGMFSLPVCLKEAKDSFFEAADLVSSNTIKTLSFARERLDWYYDIRSSFEHVFFRILSKTWLLFLGYNPDDSVCGVCGKGKEVSNVRITSINGILNGLVEAKRAAQQISNTHGNAPVHFIYSATRGFSGDMVRALFLKIGVTTKQTKLLAKMWRRLIQEMGGAGRGGEIIHYAHSLGGTETLNALKMLSIEERKMIRVVTFGSPTLLPDGLCLRVDNFVSTKDGVPFFDLRRVFSEHELLQSNVHLLQAESSLPFIDHLLEGKTYSSVLDVLGQEFQEKYRLSLSQ